MLWAAESKLVDQSWHWIKNEHSVQIAQQQPKEQHIVLSEVPEVKL
jgi:hypothetical protein